MIRQELDEWTRCDIDPFDDRISRTLCGPEDHAEPFPETIDGTRLRNLDPAIDRIRLVIQEPGYEVRRSEEGIFTRITWLTKT
jgi:hypothetical protein